MPAELLRILHAQLQRLLLHDSFPDFLTGAATVIPSCVLPY